MRGSGRHADIDLGYGGQPYVLDLGELGSLHVLLHAGEIAHALMVRLKSRVDIKGNPAAGDLLSVVDVLEKNEVSDDRF